MRVDLPYLLFALLLLWFPRQWMRLGKAFLNRQRTRSEGMTRREEEPWHNSEPGDPAVSFRTEFGKIRNYIDLLRGAAGSLSILGGMGVESCITLPSEPTKVLKGEHFALEIAILIIGLVIQAVRNERGRYLFFPPIFFVAGLTLGLCGDKAAGFAFVMIWAVNPMLKNPSMFLTVYALLVGLFGLFFNGVEKYYWVVAMFLVFLPVLLSAMAQRPLVMLARKTTRTPRH